MSVEGQDAENMIEQQQQDNAAMKNARDSQHAQNGTKSGEATPIAFSYDPAGAEAIFGKVGEDGRPANIPAKYWDGDGRKVKGDVLFNQLRWAEGKLGEKKVALMGAPTGDYAINVPKPEKDGEEPWEIPADDPAVKALFTVAKKYDVSQRFVDEVIAEVVKNAETQRPANMRAEIEKLGKDGKERLANFQDFLGANVQDKAQVKSLLAMVTSAENFQALEALVRATAAPKFAPKDPEIKDGVQKMTREQWEALNFEMVEHGGQKVRRRSVDPEFNKRVEALRDEVFGVTRRDASGREVTESGQRI